MGASSESREERIEAELASLIDATTGDREARLQALRGADPTIAAEAERWLAWLEERGLLLVDQAIPSSLGEFRILDRIGGGGMGVVFRAEQPSLGREIALKVLRPGLLLFENARERFDNEGRAIASLSHPNIVPVHGVGEDRGVPYLAMEWIDGVSLADAVAALGEVDPASLKGAALREAAGVQAEAAGIFRHSWEETAIAIVHEVAKALEHAHARGVVHRDVKPSNIMLGRDGRVLLLDFGLAQIGDDHALTRTGDRPGSLPYMAPEQIERNAPLDERTDLYSLGVTLYQLLTLRLPYATTTVEATQRRVLDGDPLQPSSLNRRLSWESEVVCLTAMARDRRQRYASANALCADLAAILDKRPIAARPQSKSRRALRWVQRRPAAALGVVLAFVVCCVLPLVLYLQAIHANAQVLEQKEAAEESFRSALRSVNQLVSKFTSSGVRASSPKQRAQVIEFYEKAAAFYQTWLPRRRNDRGLLRSAGIGWQQLAQCNYLLGRREGCVTAAEEAIETFDRLEQVEGPSGFVMTLRAKSRLRAIEALRALQRKQEARAHMAAALRESRMALVRTETAEGRRAALKTHAQALMERIGWLSEAREYEAVFEQAAELRAVLEEHGRLDGAQAIASIVLVTLETELGKVENRRRRHEAAASHFAEAIRIARGIVGSDDDPMHVLFKQSIAVYYAGAVDAERGRMAAATKRFDESLRGLRRVVREEPGNVVARSRLVNVLYGVGRTYRLTNALVQARPHLDELIEIADRHGLQGVESPSRRLLLHALRLRVVDLLYRHPDRTAKLFDQLKRHLVEARSESSQSGLFHREVAECLRLLGDSYFYGGQLKLAGEALAEAADRFKLWVASRRAGGTNQADAIFALNLGCSRARVLLARDEGAKAIAMLDRLGEDASGISRARLKSVAVKLDQTRAWALAAQGRVAEAVEISKSNIRGLVTTIRRLSPGGRDLVLTRHTVFRIAKCATRSADPEQRRAARDFVASFARLTKRFAGDAIQASLLERLGALERALAEPR